MISRNSQIINSSAYLIGNVWSLELSVSSLMWNIAKIGMHLQYFIISKIGSQVCVCVCVAQSMQNTSRKLDEFEHTFRVPCNISYLLCSCSVNSVLVAQRTYMASAKIQYSGLIAANLHSYRR